MNLLKGLIIFYHMTFCISFDMYISDEAVSWEKAVTTCEDKGMSLATVNLQTLSRCAKIEHTFWAGNGKYISGWKTMTRYIKPCDTSSIVCDIGEVVIESFVCDENADVEYCTQNTLLSHLMEAIRMCMGQKSCEVQGKCTHIVQYSCANIPVERSDREPGSCSKYFCGNYFVGEICKEVLPCICEKRINVEKLDFEQCQQRCQKEGSNIIKTFSHEEYCEIADVFWSEVTRGFIIQNTNPENEQVFCQTYSIVEGKQYTACEEKYRFICINEEEIPCFTPPGTTLATTPIPPTTKLLTTRQTTSFVTPSLTTQERNLVTSSIIDTSTSQEFTSAAVPSISSSPSTLTSPSRLPSTSISSIPSTSSSPSTSEGPSPLSRQSASTGPSTYSDPSTSQIPIANHTKEPYTVSYTSADPSVYHSHLTSPSSSDSSSPQPATSSIDRKPGGEDGGTLTKTLAGGLGTVAVVCVVLLIVVIFLCRRSRKRKADAKNSQKEQEDSPLEHEYEQDLARKSTNMHQYLTLQESNNLSKADIHGPREENMSEHVYHEIDTTLQPSVKTDPSRLNGHMDTFHGVISDPKDDASDVQISGHLYSNVME